MKHIERFFTELNQRWKIVMEKKISLSIIGSSALLLQTQYDRGTKDSDILETKEMTPEINKKLLSLGGKDSDLHKKFRIYLDIVKPAIPFLPQKPKFNSVPSLQKLENFEILALDPTDVVVSKLKRFSATDASDVQAMVTKGFIDHKRLIERFKLAVDFHAMDARASDLPKYIKNLNTVERDYFMLAESKIELPSWID